MSSIRRLFLLTAAITLVGAAPAGCDLLSDATSFTVDTEWQSFTVDSDALGVTVPESTIPEIPCAAANDICAQSSSLLSCSSEQYSCDIICGAAGSCELNAMLETSVSVDLSQKIKSQTSAQALGKASLSWVHYRVQENSLSVDTPSIEVYVGPESAAGVGDAGVVKFATMPSIPSATTPDGEVQDITAQGRDALLAFVKNYEQPFRFFVRAALRLAGGDPLPQGRLTIEMKAGVLVEPL